MGTHSVHMVIARMGSEGSSETLFKERTPVRLGAGGGDMRRLGSAAIDRAVAALSQCRHIADAHRAEVAAVATSAVREAENASEFLGRARDEAAVQVEVISGAEEARLIHLGALSAVAVADRPHLVIDIGGGSTELIAAAGTEPALTRSLKLGHIRLTDRFFPGGSVKPGAVEACRSHIRSCAAPAVRAILETGFDVAVGCSGTVAAVAAMCALQRRRPLRTVANAVIREAEISGLASRLAALSEPEDRAGVPGLRPRRRDVIVAGAVLLGQLCEDLGVAELTTSKGALREGLLIDRFNRHRTRTADGLRHLGDLRRSSVQSLVRAYHVTSAAHAEQATDLSLQLFDGTAAVHRLAEPDRLTLEAAGLLHNIGRSIAHSAHHKHSYYLIRHSDRLAGFTEDELELIALVARYHRKRQPRESHSRWSALSAADRRRVRVLSGLLRVGIALDRTYRRAVRQVRVSTDGEAVTVSVTPADGICTDIELFTARERRGLLEEALARRVRFRVVGAG